MGFNLNSKIDVLNQMANVDKRYGPHPSLSAAKIATAGTREQGLTVGVLVSGVVVEYHFKSGITDSDLVLKDLFTSSQITDFETTVQNIGVVPVTRDAIPATVPSALNITYKPRTLNAAYPNFNGLTPTKANAEFIYSSDATAWTLHESDIDLTGYTPVSDFSPVQAKTASIINDETQFVIKSGVDGTVGLRLKADGVLQVLFAQLLELYIGSSTLSVNDRFPICIVNENGEIGFAVNKNAEVLANLIKFVEFNIKSNKRYSFSIAGEDGALGLALNKKSELLAQTIRVSNLFVNGQLLSGSSSIGSFLPFVYGRPTDYLIIDSYGQSNSVISGSMTNILTSVQKYDALKADCVTPYVEVGGETLLGGALDKFTELIADKKFVPYDKKGFKLIGVPTGVGGKSITLLSKGGDERLYENMLSSIAAIKAIADAQGKTVSMPFSFWTQGEDEQGRAGDADATYDAYKAKLYQLIIDKNRDIKTILGQPNNFPLIGYQINSQNGGLDHDLDRISKAHLDTGLENPLFVCACPSYHLLIHLDDTIHFTPRSKRILGAYYAKAAIQTVMDGKKFYPLHPIQFIVTGNNLKVIYYVPCPPLVFDTTLVPAYTNKGIRVLNSSGTDLTLSNIQIINENTISIDCSASPAGGKYIFARTHDATITNVGNNTMWIQGGGNLRDSEGDTVKGVIDDAVDANDPTNQYPLHNWAVVSYKTIN